MIATRNHKSNTYFQQDFPNTWHMLMENKNKINSACFLPLRQSVVITTDVRGVLGSSLHYSVRTWPVTFVIGIILKEY